MVPTCRVLHYYHTFRTRTLARGGGHHVYGYSLGWDRW